MLPSCGAGTAISVAASTACKMLCWPAAPDSAQQPLPAGWPVSGGARGGAVAQPGTRPGPPAGVEAGRRSLTPVPLGPYLRPSERHPPEEAPGIPSLKPVRKWGAEYCIFGAACGRAPRERVRNCCGCSGRTHGGGVTPLLQILTPVPLGRVCARALIASDQDFRLRSASRLLGFFLEARRRPQEISMASTPVGWPRSPTSLPLSSTGGHGDCMLLHCTAGLDCAHVLDVGVWVEEQGPNPPVELGLRTRARRGCPRPSRLGPLCVHEDQHFPPCLL